MRLGLGQPHLVDQPGFASQTSLERTNKLFISHGQVLYRYCQSMNEPTTQNDEYVYIFFMQPPNTLMFALCGIVMLALFK